MVRGRETGGEGGGREEEGVEGKITQLEMPRSCRHWDGGGRLLSYEGDEEESGDKRDGMMRWWCGAGGVMAPLHGRYLPYGYGYAGSLDWWLGEGGTRVWGTRVAVFFSLCLSCLMTDGVEEAREKKKSHQCGVVGLLSINQSG